MIRWNKEEILRALETDVGAEAKAQLRAIVEQHFSEPPKTVDEAMQKAHEEGVRQVFGKADTQAGKSTEPVKDTAQTTVEQAGEVDGFLADLREVVDGSRGVDGWHLNDDMATWGELNITVDRIDKLLSHLPTSGNDMSDKRTVSREWIEKELNAHLRLEDEALRDYVHVIADIIVEIFTAFGIEVMKK